jgi:hypothetical protein
MTPINSQEYEWLEDLMCGEDVGLSQYNGVPYLGKVPDETVTICRIFNSPESKDGILNQCRKEVDEDGLYESNAIGYVGTTKEDIRYWLFINRTKLKLHVGAYDERIDTLHMVIKCITNRIYWMNVKYEIIDDTQIMLHTRPVIGPIWAQQGGFRAAPSFNGHIRGGILVPPNIHSKLVADAKRAMRKRSNPIIQPMNLDKRYKS